MKDAEVQQYESIRSNPEVTIEHILSIFSKKSEQKRMKEIKAAVVSLLIGSQNGLFDESSTIEKQVEEIIRQDQRLKDNSLLTYSKGKYKQRPSKSLPGGADVELQSKDFTGRAGECAVMSELLFRGYNVNRMMVDGGIDLVAFKDGAYYFYQVKTVSVANGIIQAQISLDNYEKNKGYSSQMRYVIVARYRSKNGTELNHYFVFTQQDIDKEIFDKSIKRGEMYISIKIKFSELTGEPVLYDANTERRASWYYNHF